MMRRCEYSEVKVRGLSFLIITILGMFINIRILHKKIREVLSKTQK